MYRILLLLLIVSPLGASGRAEGAIQKSWDYANVTSVVVDADRQDVVVTVSSSRVTGRLVGQSGDEARIVRDGDKLVITVRSERGWFSWSRRSSRVELAVPADISLDLTTASGAVLVRVPTAELAVHSASGDIEAPQGGRSVRADTASGTVRLKGFRGSVEAASLSGDVLLEDIVGSVRATSMSGDLRGRALAPTEGSRFSTVSGDATLDLVGGGRAYRIQAESVSGQVDVAPGSGPALVVKSVSGDVRVP